MQPSPIFVLMPFSDTFLRLYSEAIVPALELHGCLGELAPDIKDSRDVMANIYRGIWLSRLVIADLTGLNANVHYELGLAAALNKQLILLTQDITEVPFDLKRDRILQYSDNPAGRVALRKNLAEQLQDVLQLPWTSSPSWKEALNVNVLPVSALLEAEATVQEEVWVVEPEESFQDTAFHEVIRENLRRRVRYRFVVADHPDVEDSFRSSLGRHYGEEARVLYVPEASLQIPLSLAILDPTSPHEKGFQYLPNGLTVFGVPLPRAMLRRARRLFLTLWRDESFRIAGGR